MVDVRALVEEFGGLAQKRQLVDRGAADYDLTRAVKRGDVIRARQGWYTTLEELEPRVRAVRVGGRLTGISAIRDWGGWVLGDHPLHVSVPRNAARLRSQWNRREPLGAHPGVQLHWDPPVVGESGSDWSVSVTEALRRVIIDENHETAIAALDWALHAGRIDSFDFEKLIIDLPAHKRRIRSWVAAECESLPESLARTRLRLAGHRVDIQVPLGNKRIDVVIDGTVGLEINGKQFHSHTFEEDHVKSAEMTIAGFYAMSVSAHMVFSKWNLVTRALDAALVPRPPSRCNAPCILGNSGNL